MNQKLNFLLMFVACLFFQVAMAQTVSGTVSDDSGMPLPGVNVVEKGTTNGASTDFDGNYQISVSGGATLVFSSLGYATQEVAVNNRSSLNVTLAEDASQLDEVVVTALGIRKETKALGYSLTEVGGEELANIKVPNAINALQGKVAGVNVSQNSTGVAGSSRVIIRGSSSLTGSNQPLYVVDGIPIGNDNNGSAGLWGGSDGGDGISSINPDDIESVSVLKGGAASALYGSRAANGVILITTKSGEGQKGLGVEVSSQLTFNKVNTNIQDFQTEYGQGRFGRKPANADEAFDIGLSSWGARLDGSSVPQWDGVSRPYSYAGNNFDRFYRTGTTFINTVALTSGNENMNYRFSVSDLDADDIVPNSGFNRKTFSLNASARMGDRLTSSVNAKYFVEDGKNRPRLSDAPGNPNFTVANLAPNVDVSFMDPGTNEDGTERQYSSNTFSQNPYFAANNFRREDTRNRIIASTSLRYDIMDWLYVTGRVGVDHYTRRATSVEPFGTAYRPLGAINEDERRYTQIDSDIILGGDYDVNDKIGLSAFVGANKNSIETENLGQRGTDFIVAGLEDVGNTQNQSRSRSYGKRKIGSVYGSLELSYENWAYLTFTGRNDWFSTLSFPGKTTPNDEFYPSINASIILSDALEIGGPIDFLKLRGGYSEVAGGAQDPYQLALNYEIFGQGHLGNPLGRISGGQVPNANLVPFSKSETEIGFDIRMLDNRVSLDFAVYKNHTPNDIFPVVASVVSGFGSALANLGEIENKWVEWLLSVTPFRSQDFTWTTSFNGAFTEGRIIATKDEDGQINLGSPKT
ncbi:MAG: SusC/RagA family TonB-linked outer membrane protein, partial [Flavobacteriaceae bacterium]